MNWITYKLRRGFLRCRYSSNMVDAYLAEHQGNMLLAADWENEAYKVQKDIEDLDIAWRYRGRK